MDLKPARISRNERMTESQELTYSENETSPSSLEWGSQGMEVEERVAELQPDDIKFKAGGVGLQRGRRSK